MECPKCNAKLQKIHGLDFDAYKCEGCGGLWFPEGSVAVSDAVKEHDKLEAEGSEARKEYNKMKNINCPVCNKRMISMIDKSQYHIEYEACYFCNGVFLDAGELTDMAEFTLLEKVRQVYRTVITNLT